MSPVDRSARSRRQIITKIATIVLTAVVLVVGLWGVGHGDDSGGVVLNETASSVTDDMASNTQVSGLINDGTSENTEMLGVVTCILGLLCGFALATLLFFFTLRYRPLRSRRLRPPPTPISFPFGFSFRGRHRFGILDLNLLRI